MKVYLDKVCLTEGHGTSRQESLAVEAESKWSGSIDQVQPAMNSMDLGQRISISLLNSPSRAHCFRGARYYMYRSMLEYFRAAEKNASRNAAVNKVALITAFRPRISPNGSRKNSPS